MQRGADRDRDQGEYKRRVQQGKEEGRKERMGKKSLGVRTREDEDGGGGAGT